MVVQAKQIVFLQRDRAPIPAKERPKGRHSLPEIRLRALRAIWGSWRSKGMFAAPVNCEVNESHSWKLDPWRKWKEREKKHLPFSILQNEPMTKARSFSFFLLKVHCTPCRPGGSNQPMWRRAATIAGGRLRMREGIRLGLLDVDVASSMGMELRALARTGR